jgi:hypothetical protein
MATQSRRSTSSDPELYQDVNRERQKGKIRAKLCRGAGVRS